MRIGTEALDAGLLNAIENNDMIYPQPPSIFDYGAELTDSPYGNVVTYDGKKYVLEDYYGYIAALNQYKVQYNTNYINSSLMAYLFANYPDVPQRADFAGSDDYFVRYVESFLVTLKRISFHKAIPSIMIALEAAYRTLISTPTPRTFTVSYNANGGKNAPGSQTKTEGTALALTTDEPAREGYTFKGWALSESGAAAYEAGAAYADDADVTLYAVWAKEPVKREWLRTLTSLLVFIFRIFLFDWNWV